MSKELNAVQNRKLSKEKEIKSIELTINALTKSLTKAALDGAAAEKKYNLSFHDDKEEANNKGVEQIESAETAKFKKLKDDASTEYDRIDEALKVEKANRAKANIELKEIEKSILTYGSGEITATLRNETKTTTNEEMLEVTTSAILSMTQLKIILKLASDKEVVELVKKLISDRG